MKKKKKTVPPRKTDNYSYTDIITFGEPEPISFWGNYGGIYTDQAGYYTPPVDRTDLVKIANQCAYHGAILRARTNMITTGYTGGALTTEHIYSAVYNLLLFGDTGILKIRNGFGTINKFSVLPSLYLRRNSVNETIMLQQPDETSYRENDVVFIKQYDPQQQVYGVPDYIHGLESAMLNFDSTRFRRRYFKNGAHLGYILYSTDPNMSEETEAFMRQEIARSRGAGNFKSMFINIPGGDKDGVKVIPIGDSGAKDEFLNVKNISAQDQLVAHRFPPGLAGIIPENTGGFGDPVKIRETYYKDEIIPMRKFLMNALNADPDIQYRGKIIFELTPPDTET